MNVLLITQAYPSDSNKYALAYIHTRVLEYQKRNVNVDVLSFSVDTDYRFQGVNVICQNTYSVSKSKKYDVLISHAPNLRNHIPFVLRYASNFKKFIFFFHGHEVMNVAIEYPRDYQWVPKRNFTHLAHLLYSPLKFIVLKCFFKYLIFRYRVKFIFVSKWMQSVFEKNIFSPSKSICSIVNNPANPVFLNKRHSNNNSKKCITIRPWDKSKYAIDLVINFAKNNPDYHFDIYGNGQYPSYNLVPSNCTFIEGFFSHDQLPELLDNYQYAIFPTRLDAQGVMVCEIASYGMPLYVNQIPIMTEMLSEFDNVCLINTDDFSHQISNVDFKLSLDNPNKFDIVNIVSKELVIFYE